jgi:Fe-S oxidoreductase
MCRHVCPTYFSWRTDAPTPHGRALLIHHDITGTRELDERGIEVLYQCLECSHCLTWCNPEIDIAEIVEERRREIVKDGLRPQGLDKMAGEIKQHHNPFGEPHEERSSWLQSVEGEGRKLLYFTGCTAAYREKEIAESTVDLLGSIGFSVEIMNDEYCCGSPLFRTGDDEAALALARHNVELLNASNCDEIVVTCPGCYRALTSDYAKHGLEITKSIRHISQILSENLDSIPKSATNSRITYHDPCHLGRHSGIYDEPRNVLKRVVSDNLVEMERTRENAMCCGNGAGLRTLFPDHAKQIGSERIKQAKDTGAEYLVTSCPFCKNMLASQADEGIVVVDLPEFVQMSRDAKKD